MAYVQWGQMSGQQQQEAYALRPGWSDDAWTWPDGARARTRRRKMLDDIKERTMAKIKFKVIQGNGWSYVVDADGRDVSGPWRYMWEAQDHADDLNGKLNGTEALSSNEQLRMKNE